jgi:DNA-binding CsgD family transcriptional regulator/tetratricopeptide (TPR) repeat protein
LTDLLERAEALRTLEGALAETRGGRGRNVIVSGEAGVGKTALLRALADRPALGARILWGECDPLFTPRPLGPLQDIAFEVGGALREAFAGDRARETLFGAALAEFGREPTVLVLEDLHWADAATLDLLRYLGRRTSRRALLLVGTYRSDELPAAHPLRAALGDLPAAATTRLALAPLSEAAVAELAAAAGASAGEIFRLTRGNPFYVTEVLANRGQSLPESVRDATLARVARLSETARHAVERLSALPGGASLTWLDTLRIPRAGIDEGIAAGVLESGRATVSFRHDLARRSVEEARTEAERQRLHRDVYACLRSLPEAEVALPRLVHHALHAGDHAAAGELAPRAAEQAAAAGANAEAATLFQLALRHGEGLSPARRAELLEGQAQALATTGSDGAQAAAEQALAIHRKGGDRLGEGRVLVWLSRWWWLGTDRARAEALAAEAIAVLEREPPGRELAMAYSNLSRLSMVADDYPATLEWGRRALALAERVGDLATTVHALNNIGAIEMCAGNLEAGTEALQRSLAIAHDQPGFGDHAGRAYFNLASSLVGLFELERALPVFAEGIEFCQRHDMDPHVSYLLVERVGLDLHAGNWDAGAHGLVRVRERGARYPLVRSLAAEYGAQLAMRRGEPVDDAEIAFVEASARRMGEAQRIGPLAGLRAEQAWLAGDAAACAAAVTEVLPPLLEHVRTHRLAPQRVGDLALWAWRAGALPAGLPPMPDPYRLEISGRWQEAAQWWGHHGCRYDRALALLYGDAAAVREALAEFERLGARAVAELARRRLRELGARPVTPGPRAATRAHPAGLTAREQRVLELLVEGRTNGEIARTLVRSAKTVEHHVSAILAKLGAASRTEAAARARRLGVLPSPPEDRGGTPGKTGETPDSPRPGRP